MTFLCVSIGIGTLIVSLLFFAGHGLNLISGWTKLSVKEKTKINAKKLERNVAMIFLLISIIFSIAGYSNLFREKYFLWSMVAWLTITGLDIYWLNSTKRIFI